MSRRRSPVLVEQNRLRVLADPDRPGGRLLELDGRPASYIDLEDPTHLGFDYLRWIRSVLVAAGARRVLHLGGGAAALARAMLAADPAGRHEVCEIDPAVVIAAREHMGLHRAPGLRVRVRDGRERLTSAPDRGHDAVVIDAFCDGAVVPGLVDAGALTHALRVAPLVLVNVADGRPGPSVDTVAATLVRVADRVLVIGRAGANRIVVGARAAVLLDLARLEGVLASDPSPARLVVPRT